MKILIKGIHISLLESLSEVFSEHTFYVLQYEPGMKILQPNIKNITNFIPKDAESYDLFIGHVEGSSQPNSQPNVTKNWKIPKVWIAWYICGLEVFSRIQKQEPVIYTTYLVRDFSLISAKTHNLLTENVQGPQIYPCQNPSTYVNYNGKIRSGLMVVGCFELRKTFGKNLYDKIQEIFPNTPIKVIGQMREGRFPIRVPFEEQLEDYRNNRVYLELVEEGRPLSCSSQEAMMTGMPIISTAQGEYPLVIHNGIEGFLVDKKNPKEISDTLNTLLDNESMAMEMGRKARQRALTMFNAGQFRIGFEEAFDFALGKQSKWFIDQETKRKFYQGV